MIGESNTLLSISHDDTTVFIPPKNEAYVMHIAFGPASDKFALNISEKCKITSHHTTSINIYLTV